MAEALAPLKYWQTRIEQDLASFSDPGTKVAVTPSGRTLRAEWVARQARYEALFSIHTDRIDVTFQGRTVPYRQFLVGPEMADLRSVAQMIVQAYPRTIYIPTKAVRSRGSDEPRGATELLAEMLAEPAADATRVIMVTGDAGSGKTEALQQIVRETAEAYTRGQTDSLLLYVNAQGRALARLNEALATELQDLRVTLTYHSVAALTRLGVITPVIDGFDELLGVSGYDDAFSSLSRFLDLLAGEGQLIASARSVYYEEEFLSRAGQASSTIGMAWLHDAINILGWTEEERAKYVSERLESISLTDEQRRSVSERLKQVFSGQTENLARKPLFVSRTLDLVIQDPTFQGGDDLLLALVEAFLERERLEKLLDRQETPLLSADQLELLLTELAQEMWNQETRELDGASIREIAEYVLLNERIPDAAQQIVIERMPTLAFLARAESRQGIAFEHEVFFFFFLAKSLLGQYFATDADLRIILSRSALPREVADRAASQYVRQSGLADVAFLQGLFDRLRTAGDQEWRRRTQVRENAGLLVQAVSRYLAIERVNIERSWIGSIVFPGGDLSNVTFRECRFTDVEIRRTDLTSTKFESCKAENLIMYEPTIDRSTTRLDIMGVDPFTTVFGVRVRQGEVADTIFDPHEIASAMADCGMSVALHDHPEDIGVSGAVIVRIERLMRAYNRANPICTSDDNLQSLFSDDLWQEIERLLLEHKIVTREQRTTKGRPKTFLRRQYLPSQVMAGVHPNTKVPGEIRRFWASAADQFPKIG